MQDLVRRGDFSNFRQYERHAAPAGRTTARLSAPAFIWEGGGQNERNHAGARPPTDLIVTSCSSCVESSSRCHQAGHRTCDACGQGQGRRGKRRRRGAERSAPPASAATAGSPAMQRRALEGQRGQKLRVPASTLLTALRQSAAGKEPGGLCCYWRMLINAEAARRKEGGECGLQCRVQAWAVQLPAPGGPGQIVAPCCEDTLMAGKLHAIVMRPTAHALPPCGMVGLRPLPLEQAVHAGACKAALASKHCKLAITCNNMRTQDPARSSDKACRGSWFRR